MQKQKPPTLLGIEPSAGASGVQAIGGLQRGAQRSALWCVAVKSIGEIRLAREVLETASPLLYEKLGPEWMSEWGPLIRTAPQFEARHVIIDAILNQLKITQVLEIGAGLSPRSLYMSREGVAYSDLDLPFVAALKEEVAERIGSAPSSTLTINMGSADNSTYMAKAVGQFTRRRRIAVVMEGVLRYHSIDKKIEILSNIAEILSQFKPGSVLITPDRNAIEALMHEDRISGSPGLLDRNTGSKLAVNMFRTFEDAERLYLDQGFEISERHPFGSVAGLISPIRLRNAGIELTDQQVADMLGPYQVLLMRLKRQ